jgi:hypothetical protein
MCIGQFSNRTKGKVDYENPQGYETMIPFDFKWREKIGKVECDCKEVREIYAPYYGWTWEHSDDCALIKQLEKKPQLGNLWCYQSLPIIAQSE